MNVSRVSAKGQVTIPAEIREAMSLQAGDLLLYEMEGKIVKIRKLEPFDAAYHAAVSETLGEWDSPEDDEAFRDL